MRLLKLESKIHTFVKEGDYNEIDLVVANYKSGDKP
jgi:hypothetical protein